MPTAKLIADLEVAFSDAQRVENSQHTFKTKLLGQYGRVKVFEVDGEAVRDVCPADQEFGSLATSVLLPQVIPPNEVWIEGGTTDKSELPILIASGLAEIKAHDAGMSDDAAYAYAERREAIERENRHRAANGRTGYANADQSVYADGGKPIAEQDGYQVRLVHGDVVRNLFKVDWTEGGNPEVYSFVPEHEIWVEAGISPRERKFIILHEITEAKLMRGEGLNGQNKGRKLKYDEAHDIASQVEWNARSATKPQVLAASEDLIHRRPAAIAVIHRPHDNRFLLGKSTANDDRKDKYCFVGGGIDSCESPVGAALREAREESGIHPKPTGKAIQLLGKEHLHFVPMKVGREHDDLQPNDEFSDMGWFTVPEMRDELKHDLYYSIIPVIKRLHGDVELSYNESDHPRGSHGHWIAATDSWRGDDAEPVEVTVNPTGPDEVRRLLAKVARDNYPRSDYAELRYAYDLKNKNLHVWNTESALHDTIAGQVFPKESDSKDKYRMLSLRGTIDNYKGKVRVMPYRSALLDAKPELAKDYKKALKKIAENEILQSDLIAASFDEAQHPREHGRFVSKGGGAAVATPTPSYIARSEAQLKEYNKPKFHTPSNWNTPVDPSLLEEDDDTPTEHHEHRTWTAQGGSWYDQNSSEVEVTVNPRDSDEVKSLIEHVRHEHGEPQNNRDNDGQNEDHELRYIYDPKKDDMYVWSAYDAIHKVIAEQLEENFDEDSSTVMQYRGALGLNDNGEVEANWWGGGSPERDSKYMAAIRRVSDSVYQLSFVEAMELEFDEAQHPRGEKGRFANKEKNTQTEFHVDTKLDKVRQENRLIGPQNRSGGYSATPAQQIGTANVEDWIHDRGRQVGRDNQYYYYGVTPEQLNTTLNGQGSGYEMQDRIYAIPGNVLLRESRDMPSDADLEHRADNYEVLGADQNWYRLRDFYSQEGPTEPLTDTVDSERQRVEDAEEKEREKERQREADEREREEAENEENEDYAAESSDENDSYNSNFESESTKLEKTTPLAFKVKDSTVRVKDIVNSDRVREIFGKDLTPGQIAGAAGAPDGAKVTISSDYYGITAAYTFGNGSDVERRFERDGSGLHITNNHAFLADEDQRHHVGLEIFAREVENAVALGAKHIDTQAAGWGDPETGMAYRGAYNGYYTWPRFGYDARLNNSDLDKMPSALKERLKPEMVSDLMVDKEGRAWWKGNGRGRDMTFDLTPGSYSIKTLETYIKESAKDGQVQAIEVRGNQTDSPTGSNERPSAGPNGGVEGRAKAKAKRIAASSATKRFIQDLELEFNTAQPRDDHGRFAALTKIGQMQQEAKHNPTDPATQASYKSLKDQVVKQYHDILAKGYKFEFTDKDPYTSSQQMRDDIDKTKTLKVYSTADLPTDHPLAETHKDTGQTYNTLFRGVHDFNGHYLPKHSFGPNGELGAFQAHSKMFDETALPALAAETLAQNAWVNFGPHHPENLAPKDRPFAEQKAYAFPLNIAKKMAHEDYMLSHEEHWKYWDQDYRRPRHERKLQLSETEARDSHGRWTANGLTNDAQSATILVSPETRTGLDYATAKQRSFDNRAKSLSSKALDVAKSLGLEATIHKAIGDWHESGRTPGSEPTVVVELNHVKDFEHVKLFAAIMGRYGKQIAVLPFMQQHDGPHRIYSLEHNSKNEDIQESLTKHGIPFRTLQDKQVLVFDDNPKSSGILERLTQVAKEHGSQSIKEREGYGEFIPASSNSRAESQKKYEEIVNESYQRGDYHRRYGAGPWTRDRFRLSAAETLILAIEDEARDAHGRWTTGHEKTIALRQKLENLRKSNVVKRDKLHTLQAKNEATKKQIVKIKANTQKVKKHTAFVKQLFAKQDEALTVTTHAQLTRGIEQSKKAVNASANTPLHSEAKRAHALASAGHYHAAAAIHHDVAAQHRMFRSSGIGGGGRGSDRMAADQHEQAEKLLKIEAMWKELQKSAAVEASFDESLHPREHGKWVAKARGNTADAYRASRHAMGDKSHAGSPAELALRAANNSNWPQAQLYHREAADMHQKASFNAASKGDAESRSLHEMAAIAHTKAANHIAKKYGNDPARLVETQHAWEGIAHDTELAKYRYDPKHSYPAAWSFSGQFANKLIAGLELAWAEELHPREHGRFTTKPINNHESSGHAQLKSRFIDAASDIAHTNPQKAALYSSTMSRLIDRMNPKAVSEINSHLDQIYFCQDYEHIAKALWSLPHDNLPNSGVVMGFCSAKESNENAPQTFEDMLTGSHRKLPSETQDIYLDGGLETGEHTGQAASIEHTYAHELGHLIDGGRLKYSMQPEWLDAANEEIVGSKMLSSYAMSSPPEAFGEFSRLVWTNPRVAQTYFPRCWNYWYKNGLVNQPSQSLSQASVVESLPYNPEHHQVDYPQMVMPGIDETGRQYKFSRESGKKVYVS